MAPAVAQNSSHNGRRSVPHSRELLLKKTGSSDGGFLAASHSIEGPPIRTVADPRDAHGFFDYVSAVRRAQALYQLGWRNLRIVETFVP